MKTSTLTLLTLIAALGLSTLANGSANEQEPAKSHPRATKIAQVLEGKTFSVSAAVQAAENMTSGKAIAAEIEIERGKAVVEVIILKGGPEPQLLEVEVDGGTNKIIEVEANDSDSDSDSEDDEDADSDSDDETDDD